MQSFVMLEKSTMQSSSSAMELILPVVLSPGAESHSITSSSRIALELSGAIKATSRSQPGMTIIPVVSAES